MKGQPSSAVRPTASFLPPVGSVREVEIGRLEALGQSGYRHAHCGREPGDVPQIGERSALFDAVDVSARHPRPSGELGHGHIPRLAEATDVLSETRGEAPVCRIVIAGIVHTPGLARSRPAVEVPTRLSFHPPSDGVFTALSS